MLMLLLLRIESNFLQNLAIPFLDSIDMELDERFLNVAQQCSDLLILIPSAITNKNGNFAITNQQIRKDIQLFEDDLPHHELLQQEIFHWKTF